MYLFYLIYGMYMAAQQATTKNIPIKLGNLRAFATRAALSFLSSTLHAAVVAAATRMVRAGMMGDGEVMMWMGRGTVITVMILKMLNGKFTSVQMVVQTYSSSVYKSA